MRYNVEMQTNRELGEKEGRKEGEKKTKEKIVKALKNMNLSIEQIAQAVELTKKEVEATREKLIKETDRNRKLHEIRND